MLKNVNIKSKLAIIFIVMLIFLAGIIIYSTRQMDNVAGVADKLANDRIPKVMAL